MSPRTRLGGRIPLPRTGGAPTRTEGIFVRSAAHVKRLEDFPVSCQETRVETIQWPGMKLRKISAV